MNENSIEGRRELEIPHEEEPPSNLAIRLCDGVFNGLRAMCRILYNISIKERSRISNDVFCVNSLLAVPGKPLVY
jgi:hypothetical protein